jgi:hypothetical protein
MEYTKQLAEFLADAARAGYTFARLEKNEHLLFIGRGEGDDFVAKAQFNIVPRDGKIRFGRAEPVGGAKTLEDFWSMKDLRRRFHIPIREAPAAAARPK